MKHDFKRTCPNAADLLGGVTTLGKFVRNADKYSNHPKWLARPRTSHEYKGMAFESLIEVLINYSPIDKRINIGQYEPHNDRTAQDWGIDGNGCSHNGNRHTVQCKFRSNPLYMLTANEDHISNFVAHTLSKPGHAEADMTIFTTAAGLNQSTLDGMYHGKIKVLGFKELSKLVNGNRAFWNAFRSEMGVT